MDGDAERYCLSFCLLASCLQTAASPQAAGPAEIAYDITVRIDPVARKIEGRSVITANTSEELTLMLGRRFEVNACACRCRTAWTGGDHAAGCVPGGFRADQPVPRRIVIHWRGEFAALDTSLDHPQTLGRDEPASGESRHVSA